MDGIRALMANIIVAEGKGEQVKACKDLEDRVNQYVKHSVINELENALKTGDEALAVVYGLEDRIAELKNNA